MTVGGLKRELQGVPDATPVHLAIGRVNNVAWRELFTVSEVEIQKKRHLVIVAREAKNPSPVN